MAKKTTKQNKKTKKQKKKKKASNLIYKHECSTYTLEFFCDV